MADSKKYDGSQWKHSLRKLTTATEAVENPLYSDGTAITAYTIKGNTVQNGTPTPSNPVEVNGVGARTENLFDESTIQVGGLDYLTGAEVPNENRRRSGFIAVNSDTYYSISRQLAQTSPSNFWILGYDENKNPITDGIFSSSPCTIVAMGGDVASASFWCTETTKYIRWYVTANNSYSNLMLNLGSTALPYEPFGYKIPISSGGVTTNIYLGSTQTMRQIKKLVFTGEELWGIYTGTDYTVFYLSDVTDYLKVSGNISLCTHYQTNDNVTGASSVQEGVCFIYNNAAYRLYIRDSSFTTTTQLRQFLADEYANGTPVTVYYILATAETATVNEPLMKIGDYADTLSNAPSIPTTEGANSITVDTTVQPSEFTATWTGWHDASVKEKSENLFDGTVRNAIINDSTGEETPNANWRCSNFVEVSAEKVTLSWTSDSQFYQAKLGYYEADETFISTETIQGYFYSGTFTIPNNCKRIKISYSVVVSGGQVTRENIMLNTGSTALPYEPYWK